MDIRFTVNGNEFSIQSDPYQLVLYRNIGIAKTGKYKGEETFNGRTNHKTIFEIFDYLLDKEIYMDKTEITQFSEIGELYMTLIKEIREKFEEVNAQMDFSSIKFK